MSIHPGITLCKVLDMKLALIKMLETMRIWILVKEHLGSRVMWDFPRH